MARCDGIRMNVEGDRLSSLPDDLIYKIFSLISIKHAVEISGLSSRWRFIWTSLPCLNFYSKDFPTPTKFGIFVDYVLYRRNNHIQASSVKLDVHGNVSHVLINRILHYAFSHNVEELTVTCLLEKTSELPPFGLSSQSLKRLTLTSTCYEHSVEFASTWELPALTTLYLDCITLSDKCIALLSKCMNLKNLTLYCCKIIGPNVFNICHPRLSNLTLKDGLSSKDVNVVAPQLKNLTIINCNENYRISAPELASLLFKSDHPLQLSTPGFHSLEKVDLCISNSIMADAQKILRLLQQLHTVKFLTLNLEIVELLSSSVELISHQPSPFANLMSLKIYPAFVEVQAHKKVAISDEFKKFLLDGSPRATFELVSREGVKAVRDATSAKHLMTELQVLIKKEKTMVNKAHVDGEQQKIKMLEQSAQSECEMQLDVWGRMAEIERYWEKLNIKLVKEKVKASRFIIKLANAPLHEQSAQSESEMQLDVGGRIAEIERYWESLIAQLEKEKEKTSCFILKLRQIEWFLKRLPTSQRAKLQTRFSSLCAEAVTIMNDMIEHMKISRDTKPSCLNVYANELASHELIFPVNSKVESASQN